MKILEKEYEDNFIFIDDQGNILMENRKKPMDMNELMETKKNYVVFVSDSNINSIYLEFKESNIEIEEFRSDIDNRLLRLTVNNFRFKNFDALVGPSFSNPAKFKEDFGFESDTVAGLMKEYVKFLESAGLYRRHIALYNASGIAERVFYHKCGKMFFIGNNDLPKMKMEREAIFEHFKNALIEKNDKIYGKLECAPGYYENVLMIDLNNFYGYQLITKKFLVGHPYQVLTGRREAEWDYLPEKFRNTVIDNYRVAHKPGTPRGIRRFWKGINNLTLGRSESKQIYCNRKKTDVGSFLQPQHGFQVILYGIDDMETYMDLFNQLGGTIIKVDTDGLAIVGLDREEEIIEKFNEVIVDRLRAAGLSEEDAQCGIGQFKIEGIADRYYQFADKAYCYQIGDEIEITYAGLPDSEKQEILEKAGNDFEKVVELLKGRKVKRFTPISFENNNFKIR